MNNFDYEFGYIGTQNPTTDSTLQTFTEVKGN
jgi:hypothetical protein